MFLTAHQHN